MFWCCLPQVQHHSDVVLEVHTRRYLCFDESPAFTTTFLEQIVHRIHFQRPVSPPVVVIYINWAACLPVLLVSFIWMSVMHALHYNRSFWCYVCMVLNNFKKRKIIFLSLPEKNIIWATAQWQQDQGHRIYTERLHTTERHSVMFVVLFLTFVTFT